MLRIICFVLATLPLLGGAPAVDAWKDWAGKLALLIGQPDMPAVDAASASRFFEPVIALSPDPASLCQADFRSPALPPFVTHAKLSLLLPREYFKSDIQDPGRSCSRFKMGILDLVFSTAKDVDDLVGALDARLGPGGSTGSGERHWPLSQRGSVILVLPPGGAGPELTVVIP